MIWLLLLGFVLVVAGIVIQVATGIIKEIPKVVLLGLTVIFIFIVIASIDLTQVSSMFVSSLPFAEQFGKINYLLQNIGNISDFGGVYQNFSQYFVTWEFWQEAIKLWIFTLEVKVVHVLLFREKKILSRAKKWIAEFILWYLRETIAVGLLILFNIFISKAAESWLPEDFIITIGGIVIAFFALLILLCSVKLIFHFTAPIVDVIIAFFTKNVLGKYIIETTITTGSLILIVFLMFILRVKLPAEIIGTVAAIPFVVPLSIVCYITYMLVGYRSKK